MTTQDVDIYLEESTNKLVEAANLAQKVSELAAGKLVEPKVWWASVIFVRLVNLSFTICRLLPRNSYSSSFENWDSSSIMSLGRNLIECYHVFYYLCVEKVSDDEWYCRKKILDIHDCVARRKVFESLKSPDENFALVEEQLKDELNNNKFFQALPPKRQAMFIKGENPFLVSRDDIEEKIGNEILSFKGIYKLFSHHTHSFPMSFYRMGDSPRGRGIENEGDKGYMAMTADFASQYILQATKDMVDLHEHLISLLSFEELQLIEIEISE